MQLTSKTPGLDEKLDGLLSLLMHEYEDQPAIAMGGFYDRYGEFFGEELHNLQEILFEDGLVRCFVGQDGLELEMSYPVTRPSKFYLSQVIIGGGQWKIPRGLDLGSNAAKVRAVLGQPSYVNDDCYEYVYEEKQSSASLCFKDDKLVKLVWDQMID